MKSEIYTVDVLIDAFHQRTDKCEYDQRAAICEPDTNHVAPVEMHQGAGTPASLSSSWLVSSFRGLPIRSRSEFAKSRVTAGRLPSLPAEPAVSKLTVTRPSSTIHRVLLGVDALDAIELDVELLLLEDALANQDRVVADSKAKEPVTEQ